MIRLALALLAGMLACAGPAARFVAGSGEETLAAPLVAQIRTGLEAHLRSCNFNSIADADWIEHPQEVLDERWRATLTGAHLWVRYSREQAIATAGGSVPVAEIALGFAPEFPGWFGTRSAAGVIGYEKCSGSQLMEFVCSPGLRERMPPAYELHCGELDSWRAEQLAPQT